MTMALWSGKSNVVPTKHGETHNLALQAQSSDTAQPQENQTYAFSPMSVIGDSLTSTLYDPNVGLRKKGKAFVDRTKLAEAIPHWATRLFAVGNAAALAGLIALCITQNSHFLLVIAAGLMAVAIGLRAAEQAVRP